MLIEQRIQFACLVFVISIVALIVIATKRR